MEYAKLLIQSFHNNVPVIQYRKPLLPLYNVPVMVFYLISFQVGRLLKASLKQIPTYRFEEKKQIEFSILFVCLFSRGDTLLCLDGLRTRELGQSPIEYVNYIQDVAGNNSLQWILLRPWASQQLSHFWISKEPDELRD